MVYGSDIVTCWCYTEFYVVIMQMSWPCLILISVQDFHDLLLTQLRSPINLRSVTIRDRQEMLNVSRIRMTDALKNAWTSMAYKKKKSKGNYNSKSKILIQNIVSSMKGLCYLLTTILLPLKNPPHALIQGFFHKSLKRRTPNIGPSPLSVVVRDRLTGFQDWCTLICLNYKVPEQ